MDELKGICGERDADGTVMKVNLKDLPEFGGPFKGEDPAEVMELENEADLTIASPLRYDLHVQLCGDELIARGKLAIDVGFRCVRCTSPFTTTIEEPEYDGVVNILADTETGETPSRFRGEILPFTHINRVSPPGSDIHSAYYAVF